MAESILVTGQAKGANTVVRWGEATTFGAVPAVPTTYSLGAVTYGVTLSKEIQAVVSNAITPNRARAASRAGNIDVAGALPIELTASGLGRLLKHAIGTATTVAPAAKAITVISTDVAGVVTVTCGVPHLLEVNDYVTISATNSTVPIDGQFQIQTVPSTTTFTIAVTAGTVTGAGTTGSVINDNYVHTIKNGLLPAAGIFIELGYTDLAVPSYSVYSGCKIGNLAITIGNDGFVTGTVDVLGVNQTQNAAELAVPVAFTHTPYIHSDATYTDAGAVASVNTLTLTYNNNMTTDRAVGSQTVSTVTEGVADCTLEANFFYTDDTQMDKARQDIASSNRIVLDTGADVLEFYMPVGKYTGAVGVPIDVETGLTNTLTFTASLDPTENSDLVVKIRNQETAI